jgi:uncharacterized cupredoxin-like copper-binding protein
MTRRFLRFGSASRLLGSFVLTSAIAVGPVGFSRTGFTAAAASQVVRAAKTEKPQIVTITMGPVKYNPSVISVPAGKPVILRFVNKATIDHEAYIGDAKAQDEHEKEMQAMAGMEMDHGGLPGFVEVKPGKSKDLAWTFPKAGVTFIGCHKPAHYKGGMKLRVVVKSSTGIA